MKNKSLFRQSIILLIILGLLVPSVYFLLLPKNQIRELNIDYDYNYSMWKEFYKYDEDQIDILCMGSSHSNCSIIPPVLSNQLGADCFNLSTTGANVDMISYQLEEILKTQSPKIITLELFSLFDLDKEVYCRQAFFGMRLSSVKYRALKHLLPDQIAGNLVPIAIEHFNWKNFEFPDDIIRAYHHDTTLPHDGYLLFSNVWQFDESTTLPDISLCNKYTIDLTQSQIDAMEKIITLCDEKDVAIVFVISPFIKQAGITYQDMAVRLPAIEAFCSAHDIPLVNFLSLQDDIGLTLDDFSDPGHMNIYGASKVSAYLANYLDENYRPLFKDRVWKNQQKNIDALKHISEEFNIDF